jgi:hypothetical protein
VALRLDGGIEALPGLAGHPLLAADSVSIAPTPPMLRTASMQQVVWANIRACRSIRSTTRRNAPEHAGDWRQLSPRGGGEETARSSVELAAQSTSKRFACISAYSALSMTRAKFSRVEDSIATASRPTIIVMVKR